ncbi:ABC transporter permease subunit [Azoarcus indigens]|uniref:NitT/TauT family transport system permease protein n=1 Tax=Azoarcus indigens TaxID=29545 RepID=A0A4R6EEC9_9RHOO|nr:ABC transporter permease [Azoarcus indigens]NMG67608.1 ABC transporter permease subunit [Azoarcus indigens]TDN56104.1 NitT/TauT family transport system permease protein [Azoarcus indigens]
MSASNIFAGERLRGTAASVLPLAVILLAWEAVCRAGLVAPTLLPAPSVVLLRWIALLPDPDFLHHVAQTMIRLLSGFAIALAAGVSIGLLASRGGGGLLEPVIRVLAPIPKIALYPAFVLIFGFDHASKIALVVADAVFPILLATFHGARSVEPKLLWSAWAAGASRRATIFTVVLPSALPSILTGCKIALLISCVTVFLAEMISSTDGLGHLLIRSARSFRIVDMFVPLVTISTIGLLLNAALVAVRNRLLVGHGNHR